MTKRITKTLICVLSLFAFSLKGQVMLPLFEKPTRLENINSDEAEESMPLPFLDGESMYFVRTYVDGDAKQRKKAQDVWSSMRENNIWSVPVNVFDEVNDLGNNAIIGTSKDGNRAYVFNSIDTRRKLAKGIALLEKDEEGEWSSLKSIDIEGFEIGHGYYSFYVNPDEDIMLISMAPDDDTINEDIFVSLKDVNGDWAPVIHLGEIINTEEYELSPYIADDKKTLYFSSSGHEGYGSADVFMSYRLDDTWTNWSVPKNLGKRINSSGFDAYFIIGNNKEVYFTSNRDQQYSDIYTTKIINEKRIELESLAEVEHHEVEVSSVFLLDKLPAENITLEIYDEGGNFVEEVVTDAYGQFTYTKLNPDETYIIRIAEEDRDAYLESNIYHLDEEGNKTERYVLKEEGFAEKGESEYTEKVSGVLTTKKKPLQNNALVVYDEEGFAVDTIITDESGQFNYTKLDLDQTYTIRPLNASDDDMGAFEIVLEEADSLGGVTGTINTKSQPIANKELVILDENNFPIDTVTTDDEGEFEYLKLAVDEEYSIIPTEELADEEIEELELILIDEAGEVLMVSDSAFDNSFTIIAPEPTSQLLQLKDKIESKIEEIEAEDKGELVQTEIVELASREVIVNSIFIVDQSPQSGAKLEIFNEDRKLVSITETEEDGKFNYTKPNVSDNFLIRVVDRDQENLINSDIYFVDQTGNKAGRYILTEEGLFAERGDSKYTEFVKGVFEYKEKPLQNNALVVYDEIGEAVDTIYTDEEGKFVYTKLEFDKTYTIRPVGAEDSDMGSFELVLDETDSTSNELSGTISTKKEPVPYTDLIVLDRNEFAIDTVTTDEEGEFTLLKLAVDQEYTIKPIEIETEVIEDVALVLIDEEGELILSTEDMTEESGFEVSTPEPSVQLVKLQAKIEETIIEEIALDDPSELLDIVFEEVKVKSLLIIDGIPAANQKLEIYDPSKTLVKEMSTDEDGLFNYSKTTDDEVYLIKIADRDQESSVRTNIYFVDDEGNKTGRYLLNEDGYFAELGNSQYKEFVQGTLEIKEQPLKNNALGVYDTEDIVVDTTYTDEYGKFEFTKPIIDEEYRIKPLDLTDSELVDLEIIIEASDTSAEVTGTINTVSKPIPNAELIVLDANDFALDTIATDDEGDFSYLKLAVDQVYSIVPLDVEEEVIEEAELILIDEEGEVISSIEMSEEDKFTYSEPMPTEQLIQLKLKIEETVIEEIVLEELEPEILIPDDLGELTEIEDEKITPITEDVKVNEQVEPDELEIVDVTETVENSQEVPSTQAEDEPIAQKEEKNGIRIRPVVTDSEDETKTSVGIDYVVYFGFNKWTLDDEDKAVLLEVIKLLNQYGAAEAEIFGHTDNIGSEAVNKRVAQLRAMSVKNFLIRNGISTDRLQLTAVGESQPVADNNTREGRQLNRRAEVDIKDLEKLLSGDFKKELANNLGKEADYVVYFGFNSWVIESDDEETLLKVMNELKSKSGSKAEIHGHTDNIGSEAVNLRVAQLRALSAKNFLIRNGISTDKLTVKSIGEAQPVADNATKEGRALNRRAEVLIE